MTKNLPPPKPPPMASHLDLDSFLRRHNAAVSSSSDSDDDAPTTSHRRTLDDILNDSSSSSPSSDHEHDKPLASISKPPNPALIKHNLIQRFKSDEFSWISGRKPPPATSSRSNSMFGGGVRSAGKPGAALAAAAAASRPFKSRRALSLSLVGKVSEGDDLYGFEGSVGSVNGGIDVRSESNGGDSGGNGGGVVEFGDQDGGIVVDSSGERENEDESEVRKSVVSDVESGVEVERSGMPVLEDVENGDGVEESAMPALEGVGTSDEADDEIVKEESVVGVASDVEEPKNEQFDVVDDDEGVDKEQLRNEENSELVSSEESAGRDDASSESAEVREIVDELVEDRMAELESEAETRRKEEEEEQSRSKKKPLELAEELENKQASTGQDWEEGAAAQPMKLEGVRRSSTVLGYFDVNADNVITRAIKSQVFRRDYGNPQVLAVHLNYIALGMSRGVIVVVPSRYSAQNGDNMDSKMLMLGAQGERSLAPVTSICFNQQGDLLLAGYGDGHITVWSLPKGTVAKVVSGKHKAPVVHALFLGQDPQVTQQYKAVTGDCKGLLLLHDISVYFLGYKIESQCLLDGKSTGTVLCASPLLPDEISGAASAAFPGTNSISTSSIGGVMGGVVGGAAVRKLFAEGSLSSEEGSSLSEEGVVIFVTHQHALVVSLSPKLKVYEQIAKPKGIREGALPYTAWKCTTESTGPTQENSGPDAVEKISLLAIAWDRNVQIAKLVKSKLKMCWKWTLESAAIGLAWLDDQMLVILTLAGQLCLYTRDGTLIHQTSYAINVTGGDDMIAYHSYFANAFGNPEKAYQNSLAIRGASVYVLAPTHLVVSRLLLWRERIQVLRNAGDWMGAFNMAMTLYDGHAHGVIDLPRDLHAVQEAVMPYLLDLLFSYVDEVFSYISVACSNQVGKEEEVEGDGTISMSNSAYSEIKEQFARVGGVAVEFCVHIKRTDILFDDIFSKFIVVHQRDTFLELLEPYILKDMLGSLPPEVMQALVEHYNCKGWLQRVEQCVLHMDISSLDFNQVVRLCRENGLYGALIYLFNKGLDDFRTPLEELLNVLRNHENDADAVGYRMLVYLKYCFSGLAFPPGHGAIPSQRLPSLRAELVQFLLEDSGGPKPQRSASLTSAGAYFNLYYLLELDTEATLDVLKVAFVEEPEEHFPDATTDDNTNVDPTAEDKNVMVQKTVDALVLILDAEISKTVRSSGNDETNIVVWPSKKDIGHLIEFIANYVASKRATVSKSVLSQILEYLMSENYLLSNNSEQMNKSRKRGEENVLALLHSVPQTEWNASYVLHLCEQAQFFQVCGLIHAIKGDYLAALESYMKNVDEPVHTFFFIEGMLLVLSGTESTAFRSAVISRIPELVTLSRECTFFMVCSHFNKESGRVLSVLQSSPKSLFLYLKTLVEVHSSGTLSFSSVNVGNVDVYRSRSVKDKKNSMEHYLQRISDFPKFIRDNPVEMTDELVELYLEMLCQYEPNSVLKFLETFENYRVDRCLQLCQEHGIVDAAAFLLERVGDVGSALLLILSDLNKKICMLDAAVGNISDVDKHKYAAIDVVAAASRLKEVQDIDKILQASIGLCQRNTPRLESEESESLWFHLLDSFCKPLLLSPANCDSCTFSQSPSSKMDLNDNDITWRVSGKDAPVLKRLFSQFVKEIVEGMIGFVRLPSIMSKLLSDNGVQEFGDFKPTILGMLGTYGFEMRILDTAKCLIEDDTFYTMSALMKGASKGYAPRSLICCICNCSFGKSSSSSGIRMFSCGHVTHLDCELQESGTSSQSVSRGCPICVHKKKSQKAKGKVVEQGLVSTSPYRSWRAQGATILHSHEFDAFENSGGLHQISRFEMLKSLQKNQRVIQTDTMPQLRLAPPAIYHEKVNKRNHFSAGESSEVLTSSEKPSKNRLRDLKAKGPSVRFPLKFFGKEKTRVQ